MALALLGTALWGMAPTATKSALAALDSDTLAFLRLAVAATVFRTLARAPIRAALYQRWTWIAGIALGGDFLLYTRGIAQTTASAAGVLVCVEPVVTILLAIWLLGERWNVYRVTGSVLTLAGALLVGSQSVARNDGAAPTLAGNAMVVAAACLWSVYAVAQRKALTDQDWASRLCAIFCVASLTCLPLALVEPHIHWQAPKQAWMLLAVLVLLCTSGVYIVYARAQQLLDVSVLSLLLAGIPVLSLLFAHIVLQEPLSKQLAAAAALVVAGAVALAREPAQEPLRRSVASLTQTP
ncbi:MAG: hypothetical protein KatS3mg077_1431 [Candidatus Binatia bacterium]|nr:MAG: hypothetical protein KatS3mg077_1431 [Candidatus Binatia bacterium]